MERRGKSRKPPDPRSVLQCSHTSKDGGNAERLLEMLAEKVRRMWSVASQRRHLLIRNRPYVQIGFKNITNLADQVTSVDTYHFSSFAVTLLSDIEDIVEQLLQSSAVLGHGALDLEWVRRRVVRYTREISTLKALLLCQVVVIIEDCAVVQIGLTNQIFHTDNVRYQAEDFNVRFDLEDFNARFNLEDLNVRFQAEDFNVRFDLEDFNARFNLEALNVRFQAEDFNVKFDLEDFNARFNLEDLNVRFQAEDFNVRFDLEDFNARFDLEDLNVRFQAEDFNVRFDLEDLSDRFNVEDLSVRFNLEDLSVRFNLEDLSVRFNIDERNADMVRYNDTEFWGIVDTEIKGDAGTGRFPVQRSGGRKVKGTDDEAYSTAGDKVREALNVLKEHCQSLRFCLKEKSVEDQWPDVHVYSCQHLQLGFTNTIIIN